MDIGLVIKFLFALFAAGMWLGALQMQVNNLQKDHDLHWGKDDK